MKLENSYNDKNIFPGIYRGYVVWNDDPLVKGRIKIFIPGIYDEKFKSLPECLPWARPFSPAFGGGSNNPNNEDKHVLNDEVGWCSVPHAGDMKTGSQVFVFFENGNINFPVYLGVAQSGDGWFSEHPNQHCFRSDNIRVRIDENVKDERSTCKFNSYNTYNSKIAKANLERDCNKNNWEFDAEKGNIKDLETRLDIEIEATGINAVNLNIHGNVNMHIDGDWFVEHFGNYYEYREGDRYLKHKGNTYIEEDGVYRKVLNGQMTLEHNGNTIENQIGDTIITRHGKYHDQIDNDVSHIYNQNYRVKVNKSSYEMIGHDKVVDAGHNFNLNVLNDFTTNIGGFFDLGIDTFFDINVKDNVSIHSKEGNILIQTDGQFELMDGPIVTCQGFKNMGNKGNIQFISTFGNINMQCIKNTALADFNQKSTVIPWNPEFLLKVKEKINDPNFNLTDAMLKGMGFSTDINGLADFISLLDEAEKLKIYDGLPVFLQSKMMVQNPNIVPPENLNDLSWIPSFRSEAKDWKNIHDDVMWKIPSRVMGNINIETWAGDINIKTDSTIGCAGNINIFASEKGGTFPGYKIGTVNIQASGNERIYPDPRDLFLDSDFTAKQNGKYKLFVHGTDTKNAGSVLNEAADNLIKGTFGKTFEFVSTNYNKFYDINGINVVTFGHPELFEINEIAKIALEKLKMHEAPKLGCPKCISDYLMGIPGIQEIFYMNQNIIDLKAGRHEYGFQRLNPKDPLNSRGVFNIESNDFTKISMGDGHAIDIGFIDRSFGGKNIGGISIKATGDYNNLIGKNSYRKINYLRPNGTVIDNYIFVETPFDFNSPKCLNTYIEKINTDFKTKGKGYDYIEPGTSIKLAKNCIGNESRDITAEFKTLTNDLMPKLQWKYGGYYFEHTLLQGEKRSYKNIDDNRYMIDYGFNFENSKNRLTSNKTDDLIVNFYENEQIIEDNNRWIDVQNTIGGNSRWYQVQRFDIDEHVELSANLRGYSYSFQDLSKNHQKSFTYYDRGNAWWDNRKFSKDLVPYFPDSDFEVKTEKIEIIVPKHLSKSIEHKGWAKYGNHVISPDHPKYNPPTDKCGACYTKALNKKSVNGKNDDSKDKLDMVDSSSDLWIHKKGAGVRDIENSIRVAEAHPRLFSLNKCDCGNNQSIESYTTLSAATDITRKFTFNAKNDNRFYDNRTGEVVSDEISYSAAINNHIFTLDSTHASLVKENQSPTGSYNDMNYKLYSGNTFKTILKGNQDYFNYQLSEDQKDFSVTFGEFENNFEISQNGFPNNKMKILNGTNTYFSNKRSESSWGEWPEGKNPEKAKYGDNELVISNGGHGDIDSPTPNKEIRTGLYPHLSAINNFVFSNGRNPRGKSFNNIGFNNGINNAFGSNITTFENGNNLTSGANVFRVDNQGAINGADVVNTISLNNDHQQVNLILGDHWKRGENDSRQIASLFSAGKIQLNSDNELSLNASTIKGNAISVSNNFDHYDMKAMLVKMDTDQLVLNADKSSINSNNFTILGETIDLKAGDVNVDKINARGYFSGNSTGSFNGMAGLGKQMYSTLWPIVDSIPTKVETRAAQTSVVPDGESFHTDPERPSVYKTEINKKNIETDESTSLTIFEKAKSIFKAFIKVELSFLNISTINRN